MAKIKDKVENALNEARMLVLGAQVLVGFQFRSVFEPGFDHLPLPSQLLKMVGLGLLLLAVALIISPAAYHRLVERGEDTHEIHRYTSKLMAWALLPFSLGLGIDFYVAAEQGEGQDDKQKLTDKIKHVLTECRVVLPGSQALLGFQFICVLTESFDRLPSLSKYIHLASLGLNAVAIVLLITPAAYHRLVEEGEETEHFHRFASKILIAALVPLALALAGDVYVVVQKVSDSQLVSVVSALVILAVFWELWFGLTLYRRTQRQYAN